MHKKHVHKNRISIRPLLNIVIWFYRLTSHHYIILNHENNPCRLTLDNQYFPCGETNKITLNQLIWGVGSNPNCVLRSTVTSNRQYCQCSNDTWRNWGPIPGEETNLMYPYCPYPISWNRFVICGSRLICTVCDVMYVIWYVICDMICVWSDM